MKVKVMASIIVAVAALAMGGCGGGGGGSAASNTVSGVASKGLIKNGNNNVKVYALKSDGTKGDLLATVSTGANGEYTAPLGSYSGPVLVEVSGTYTDEATALPVTITPDKPLRAACDSVGGATTVSVTPLTELAVQKAGAALTKGNIKAANDQVSAFFNVDVIATKPVDATAVALNGSGVTAAQKNYTLALAAVSQLANSATPDAVYTVIDSIKTSSDQGQTAAQFAKAMRDFANNGNNKTGVTSSTIPPELVNVGAKTAAVKLCLSGFTGNVCGIDLTFDLPSGVTLATDDSGAVSASVLQAIEAAAGSSLTAAKYTAASGATPGKVRIGLVSSSGLGSGNFLLLNCAVASGVTPTFSNSLVESGAKFVNAAGADMGGGTVTVSVTP